MDVRRRTFGMYSTLTIPESICPLSILLILSQSPMPECFCPFSILLTLPQSPMPECFSPFSILLTLPQSPMPEYICPFSILPTLPWSQMPECICFSSILLTCVYLCYWYLSPAVLLVYYLHGCAYILLKPESICPFDIPLTWVYPR